MFAEVGIYAIIFESENCITGFVAVVSLCWFDSLAFCCFSWFVQGVLDGKYDDLPEQSFYMVGGIEEVIAKAEKISKESAA